MQKTEYINKIYQICDTVRLVDDNPDVISRKQICSVWNSSNPLRPTVPGYWMSDAMEDWGKQNGYRLLFTLTKSGRRRNVTLVKFKA